MKKTFIEILLPSYICIIMVDILVQTCFKICYIKAKQNRFPILLLNGLRTTGNTVKKYLQLSKIKHPDYPA